MTLLPPVSSAPPTPRPTRARRAQPSRGQLAPALVLVAVTVTWGATFPMFKSVLTHLPVADFLSVRFVLAAAVLTIVAPRAMARLDRGERLRAGILGVLYGLAQVTSTIGLSRTSASVSGFVTGLYVVVVPVLGVLVLRRRPPRSVWVATAVATAGLGVLALHGSGLGAGVPITLLGAVLYAAHVLAMGQWARARNALGMTAVQLWVVAAIATAFALPGGVQLPSGGLDWGVMAYAALVTGVLGLVGQTWAQAQLAAERAAIIMTLEPVWAAVFAVAVGGDALTLRLLVGGVLVLGGMLVAELSRARPLPARSPNPAPLVPAPLHPDSLIPLIPTPLHPDSRANGSPKNPMITDSPANRGQGERGLGELGPGEGRVSAGR